MRSSLCSTRRVFHFPRLLLSGGGCCRAWSRHGTTEWVPLGRLGAAQVRGAGQRAVSPLVRGLDASPRRRTARPCPGRARQTVGVSGLAGQDASEHVVS